MKFFPQRRFFLLVALALPLAACEAGASFGAGMDASQNAVRGDTYGGSDVGTKSLQRLSQIEYNNSVHDLTGTALNPADDFPADEIANNFDNNVDVLSVSPSMLQTYAAAAVTLGDEVAAAAADPKTKASIYLKVAPCAAQGGDDKACLATTIASFGLRAWRRPLSAAEVSSLTDIATAAGSDLPSQVGAVVSAALTSPFFLFRVEYDSTPGSKTPHGLGAYELATRLSYFVWRSAPDDALLASAKSGALLQDAELQSQLNRMLADPRAQTLISGFASRWLLLNTLAGVQPDAATFPDFSDQVRSSMLSETTTFLGDFMLKGAPLNEMLTANYTYLDNTMANYYGLPSPNSSTMTKTTLPEGGTRLGLLTHGSILTVGSTSATSSPIKRGKLIIAQLLCAAPPPPPANIPALPSEAGTNLTLRQALAQHTANPACSACHINMDDLGFAYEGFDGAGKARTSDNNSPIDATGKYFQTTSFNGGTELAPLIAADPRFVSCATQMLYTYAMGRTVTSADAPALAGLGQNFSGKQMNVTSLITDIVLSANFRSRHGS